MPGLARKVLICAAVDGLVLHPLGSKREQGQRSPPNALTKVRYGDASISTISSRDAGGGADLSQPNSSFEAFGIVGMSLCPLIASNRVPRLRRTIQES